MKMHELTVWSKHFESVQKREKTTILRLNDCNFQVGDILSLIEFDPESNEYTGKFINVEINNVSKWINYLEQDIALISFKIIAEYCTHEDTLTI